MGDGVSVAAEFLDLLVFRALRRPGLEVLMLGLEELGNEASVSCVTLVAAKLLLSECFDLAWVDEEKSRSRERSELWRPACRSGLYARDRHGGL